MWLTKTTHGILRAMRDAEDQGNDYEAEIVVCRDDYRECYLGSRRIKYGNSVLGLLQMMAISDRSDEGGALERYRINDLGRAILRRPALVQDIVRANIEGGAWRVENDQIVRI